MTLLVGKYLNWAITATAGSGFLLFGCDQGVMSGLLTGYAFTQTFPEIDTTTGAGGSSSLQGTVVAIYEIGCFFGAIFCLIFSEKLGRRKCIKLGCIVLSAGAALQAAASGIPEMIVGRIVAGVGNGMNTATNPVWHSDLMKTNDRGRGICIELAINIFGVMAAYWVDYGMSFVLNDAQFRFPLVLQIFFAIVTSLGILVLPESPRWLIAHDRVEEAKHILWAVEKNAHDIDPGYTILKRELTEIQHAIAEERAAAAGSSIGGQCMQQISGINLITYYAPVIFQQSVGICRDVPHILADFNGIAYSFSSLIPMWCIERLGRRKLMLFAVGGQCACRDVLAGTVANGSKGADIVAIVMLFMFNFFFAVRLLAILWLLPAEYAPFPIRIRAAALATASNWIFTFLVVEVTPVSINNIGWRTYVYFGVFNAFFLPLTYLYYPETRGLSLEEIEKLFTEEKVALYWKPSMGDGGDGGNIGKESKEPSSQMIETTKQG